jgi:hypothetical protein
MNDEMTNQIEGTERQPRWPVLVAPVGAILLVLALMLLGPCRASWRAGRNKAATPQPKRPAAPSRSRPAAFPYVPGAESGSAATNRVA